MRNRWKLIIALALLLAGSAGLAVASVPRVVMIDEFGFAT